MARVPLPGSPYQGPPTRARVPIPWSPNQDSHIKVTLHSPHQGHPTTLPGLPYQGPHSPIPIPESPYQGPPGLLASPYHSTRVSGHPPGHPSRIPLAGFPFHALISGVTLQGQAPLPGSPYQNHPTWTGSPYQGHLTRPGSPWPLPGSPNQAWPGSGPLTRVPRTGQRSLPGSPLPIPG